MSALLGNYVDLSLKLSTEIFFFKRANDIVNEMIQMRKVQHWDCPYLLDGVPVK